MKNIFTLIISLFVLSVQATEISQTVISSGGTSGSTASMEISYTLGQGILLMGNPGTVISDGFQQGWEEENKHTDTSRFNIRVSGNSYRGVNEDVTVIADFKGNAVETFTWIFKGANTETNTQDEEPAVSYPKPGKYDVLLAVTFKGEETADTLIQYDAVTVLGILQDDTTICADAYLNITCSDNSMEYAWDNGNATSSLVVDEVGTYRVTITRPGTVEKYIDSITVAVSAPVDLGNDANLCTGNDLTLDAGTFATYVWNGDDTKKDQTFPVDAVGKYWVDVTDENGCAYSDTIAILAVFDAPTIDPIADFDLCEESTETITTTEATSYAWSTGATEQSITISEGGEYTVTITDKNGCKNADTVNVTLLSPHKEELGLVTSSLDGEKSIVAWMRTKDARVDTYAVLRETSTPNVWDTIANIPSDKPSYYIDTVAKPSEQQWKYKLVSFDEACGTSAESEPHSSMYVWASVGVTEGTVNLNWKHYKGLDIGTYYIYRWDGVANQYIKDQAHDGADIGATTIENHASGNVYRVAFNLAGEINPTLLKSDSGPFSQSMSNLSEAIIESGSAQLLDNSYIYPNPVSDNLFVLISDVNCKISVTTAYGQIIDVPVTINSDIAVVDVSNLMSGSYIVKVKTATTESNHVFIRE